jgi:glycosyltransferase involved in cell wall biosynthesis
MKIAFAHMYTLRNPRGIERFIISVANGLAKKGHDLTLITGKCTQPVTREWIDERVRVCEIYHYNWHKLSFIPGFMNAFLTRDYDIINLSIARGEGYAAGLAHILKKFRYNIVFQYPFEEHEKHFNAFKKFGTVRHADKLVAASGYIAQGVERCFNRPAITIPNGVDPDLFRPNIERRIDMRLKLNIPEKSPVIITVAALQGRKGISKVLATVSILKNRFPDIRYIVCGDGNDKDREAFLVKTKSLGLESNVLFMGNQKDVAAFYNVADLFVFFPEFEGFGIVAIEAMASELPVVVSQGSAFPEILSQGGGLMVDPSSPAYAAEEIRALLLNPSRMKHIGKEGRDSVLRKYSWDAVATQFEHLFEEQLNS